MKIVIAYLYYDLLNLYGESGNLKALNFHLRSQGIEPVIKFLTISDKLEFQNYDLIIISAGTEQNQKLALKHLITYKKDIKIAINAQKFFLITGNAIDLFGRNITDINGNRYKALNIFKYTVKESKKRIVSDALFITKDTNDYILGFQNQCSILKNNKYPLFEVIHGFGSAPEEKEEGIHYKNFYGTYLIGPLLVRNPKFTIDFLNKLIINLFPNFEFKKFDFHFETEAYESYFNLHYNHISEN